MNKKSSQENLENPVVAEIRFHAIGVSCSDETDGEGRKEYRSVFALGEVNTLYVDAEWENPCYGEKVWETTVITGLFRIEGDKSVCIGQRQEKVQIPADSPVYRYSSSFSDKEIEGEKWLAGIYGIVVQVDGTAVQSDAVYLMEGSGEIGHYFRLTQVGIDKVCQESESEAQARPHSYSCLDYRKLKDIRFYCMAENLLPGEWVYEFILLLSHRNGLFKSRRMVKGKQFVADKGGKTYLCMALDLGGGQANFWKEGEYTLRVVAFNRSVLSLDFTIGDREIPYDYVAEVAAGGAGLPFRNSLLTGALSKDKEEILDRLYRLVGLRKVKEEITRICEYASFIQMRRENGFSDVFPSMHLLFTGQPGSGKNTIAEILGELFCCFGILSHGRVTHCSRKDLVQEGYQAEEASIRRLLAGNVGGVIVIDRAAELYDEANPQDRGIYALQLLIRMLECEKPEVLVILSDEEEEISFLLQSVPEVSKCFPKQLYFEAYTLEELMVITRNKSEKRQLRFTPEAEEKFRKLLKKNCTLRGFDGGEFIDEQLEEIAHRMARRLMNDRTRVYRKEDMMSVLPADIEWEEETTPANGLEKLEEIIGASQLKQSIVHHLNYVNFIRERQRQGFDDVMPPLNMIFSGNPGTGKLTVAKMLGEIYYSGGVLRQPGVMVQNGRNLAADLGIPVEQTVGILLNGAAGGILYIEEACALFQTKTGLALLEMLLASLSPEEFDDRVVILADSPEETEKIWKANPALQTYFPYRFEFRDYTPEELMDIAVKKLKEKKYVLHPKARDVFYSLIKQVYGARDKHFGNAVWIDKLVNISIQRMSDRLMQIRQERELTRKELTTLLAADIPQQMVEMPGFSRDVFDEEEIAMALQGLDQMIGQEKIKKQILDFVDLARHYSQQGIKLNTRMSLQWCFTGNSGMGKKAMARIIARLYKAMGIIEKAEVWDFKAEKLLALTEEEALRILGDTLIKASGGILLFDEDSRKLSEAGPVRERVRTLLANQMAERPGACIVIYVGPRPTWQTMGGDVERMADLINVLDFENYTNEELLAILKKKLADENMKMTFSARQHMVFFIGRLTASEERNRNSARLMRVVAELMIRNCVQRLAKNPQNRTAGRGIVSVVKSDVEMFTEEFLAGIPSERKKIGFVG